MNGHRQIDKQENAKQKATNWKREGQKERKNESQTHETLHRNIQDCAEEREGKREIVMEKKEKEKGRLIDTKKRERGKERERDRMCVCVCAREIE